MSPGTSPLLAELAEQIAQNARTLQELLSKNGYPQPTTGIDSIQTYPPPADNEAIFNARSRLIESSEVMVELARGPSDMLKSMLGADKPKLAVLQTIERFNIANLVPREGSISFSDLAKAMGGVNPALLERILRYAFTVRLFREPKPGYVSHTAISVAIPSISTWLRFALGDKMWSSFSHVPSALEVWSEPSKPGQRQVPLNLALHTDKTLWQLLKSEPDGMAQFSSAMKAQNIGSGHHPSHCINGFDWASLGSGPVVDVGGGNGHISVAIAKAFPDLNIVVEDLPSNEEPANVTIPPELEGRVKFLGHDFFTPQPSVTVENAKAYFLRFILHDWSDEECLRIIRALVPEVEKGKKLYVADRVLPPPGQIPAHAERYLRIMDITMFALFGSKERSLEDWKVLLTRADRRLKIVQYRQPLGSELSMLEIGMEFDGNRGLENGGHRVQENGFEVNGVVESGHGGQENGFEVNGVVENGHGGQENGFEVNGIVESGHGVQENGFDGNGVLESAGHGVQQNGINGFAGLEIGHGGGGGGQENGFNGNGGQENGILERI